MTAKLAEKIIIFQTGKKLINQDEKVIYEYAYRLLLGRLISIVLLSITSCIFKTYIETLVFLLAFMPIRQNAGGYHFKNAEFCILFSVFFISSISIALKLNLLNLNLDWQLLILIVCDFFIFRVAPVDTKMKQLDECEKKVYGKRTLLVLIIENILYGVFVVSYQKVALAIVTAHVVTAISLIAEKVNQKMYQSGIKN